MIFLIALAFKLVFMLLNFIITLIIRLIMSVFPSIGLNQLYTVFTSFFGLFEGALNFTYFMLGDVAFILIDIIIILFTLKHLVLPVVNFVRRCMTP